jgi:3-hydroxyacyl-[acyl-carrier-protein] dehydratase
LTERTATHTFAADHPAADGHFPDNPIIPGAVLLREIIAAVSAYDETFGGGSAMCREVRSAKFHQPVRPGDKLIMGWTEVGGEVRFSCSIAGSSRPAVTGALRLSPR